jgi:hypothetical protein
MRGQGRYWVFLCFLLVFSSCEKENDKTDFIISDYTGSYRNVEYHETLIGVFMPGIYREDNIPEALKQMTHGRLEIDFTYMGGALTSFKPILYYGSVNKKENDNAIEETQFHLVVEIGHYNVIPFPVENLFYTICYDRYPVYCRDTYLPVIAGENYTFVLDKRPEGIILQLRKGPEIVSSLPSAFFPDSAQLFFRDITQQIDEHRGDSLESVLMVAQGFVGFDRGLRTFDGQVGGIRVYRYELPEQDTGFELYGIKNQHFANQQVNYSVRDNNFSGSNYIRMKYDFQPYLYEGGHLIPNGPEESEVITEFRNGQSETYQITTENIGLYELYLESIDEDDQVVHSTRQAFNIWVYPETWAFEY